ncbi:piggyBac transposable element-derived protein 4-like [Megalops cyprinoides]|uniref:piggyBac transposable element-derived protein 4-like n=1 Tax=Megalops cyprinoides TaxID=118141 RepID=UPI00186471CC|nr:piggyBac transposable element-derived protein 4-like [Megalops cyprinoides]
MVSYRGIGIANFFRQYIPTKRHLFGMKNFVLTDVKTNYTYLWDVYTGGAYQFDRAVGIGHSAVINLLRNAGLLEKGHVVYVDNFYSSPELLRSLHRANTGACGKVRQNRRGMPPQLKTLKLKPTGPMLAVSFRDTGVVSVLSIEYDTTVIAKRARCKGPNVFRTVRKPLCVEDYNIYMGGVDRADQLCTYYEYGHRSVKWYHRFYHHVKEVALVNAFIVYQECGNPLNAVDFRKKVVEGLLQRGRSRDVQVPSLDMAVVSERLVGRHFLGQNSASKPDCKVCSSRKRTSDGKNGRKQTSFFCPDKPALCPTTCFELYHTKMVCKQ